MNARYKVAPEKTVPRRPYLALVCEEGMLIEENMTEKCSVHDCINDRYLRRVSKDNTLCCAHLQMWRKHKTLDRPLRGRNKRDPSTGIYTNCDIHGELNRDQVYKSQGAKNKDGEYRVYYKCKECQNKRTRLWEAKNPDAVKNQKYKTYTKYRTKNCRKTISRIRCVPMPEYEQMFIDQNNRCAICDQEETRKTPQGKTMALCLDHCHITGIARQLLCHKCNYALGQFNDNPNLLIKAAEYVKKWKIEHVKEVQDAPDT